MKFIISNISEFNQYMYDTYITLTVTEKTLYGSSAPFDVYCTKVIFELDCAKINNLIGVSRYGMVIKEDKDYEIKSINPYSYKMESLSSVHHFIVDNNDEYHNSIKQPLLLTYKSNRNKNDFIEMVSNGITVDYFGKWNHNLDYKHASSHPDYDDWRKFDYIEWRLLAVECLAHPFFRVGKSPYGLEKSIIGYQKQFNIYINLWERTIRITYNGDRAITCIQSDRDGGYEQTRQLYDAVCSRRFKTKRDLIRWLVNFDDDLFLMNPNNPIQCNLTMNLEDPIINQTIELPSELKDCKLSFNENSFLIYDGMKYTDTNPK